MTPNNLKSLFTFKSSNNKHDHQLLNANVTLSVPKPRSETLRKSFSYKGCIFWNKLPTFIKKSDSIRVFKQNVKKYIISLRN